MGNEYKESALTLFKLCIEDIHNPHSHFSYLKRVVYWRIAVELGQRHSRKSIKWRKCVFWKMIGKHKIVLHHKLHYSSIFNTEIIDEISNQAFESLKSRKAVGYENMLRCWRSQRLLERCFQHWIIWNPMKSNSIAMRSTNTSKSFMRNLSASCAQ
jgi:hypothetical protein